MRGLDEALSQYLLGGSEENNEKASFLIAGDLNMIPTSMLLNKALERYSYEKRFNPQPFVQAGGSRQ
jgi:hypothetical protein